MFRPSYAVSLAVAASAAFSTAVVAQDPDPPQQILKDVWAASSQQLLEADFGTNALALKFSGGSAFKAIAFEQPVLGATGAAERGLIAVDDTWIRRFENTTGGVVPDSEFDFNAAVELPTLRVVTGVAVTDEGTILVTGFSRPKRVYEIWEYFPPGSDHEGAPFEPRATSTPQLTDIVFIPPEGATEGRFAGGGLLATTAKQVLFFAKNDGYLIPTVVLDAKALGLKGATEITSADLIRETNVLIVATTERKLYTAPALGEAGAVAQVADLPCPALKAPRFVVRNLEPGSQGSSVVSAPCGQVGLFDYDSTTPNPTPMPGPTGLVALAVAEGNEVTCLPDTPCGLVPGALSATIDSDGPSQLIVLQYPALCDPRIVTASCAAQPIPGSLDDDGTLHLNLLLPPAVQDALGAADITIPPYMFSADYNGRFGVVFVQADAAAFDAPATVVLEIGELIGYEMNVDVGLPRLPTADAVAFDPERLLNQDIAAYAPDNWRLPTVDGFEATPITTGAGSMLGGMRGFSAIIYGIQHDVFPASPRNVEVPGIPSGGVNVTGALPSCQLEYNSVVYVPSPDPRRYFLNLIACLFEDQERLLTEVIPNTPVEDVFEIDDLAALQTALDQVKDKLAKALSGAGPNTGSEGFGAVLSQLANFDALVGATPVRPDAEALGYAVYKNELLVRSRVLRFNIVERAIPSIPIGGFPILSIP